MPGDEKHHEQIAADRDEEKGIVRDRKKDESEDAKLKEKVQEVADRWSHVSLSAFLAIASLVPTLRKILEKRHSGSLRLEFSGFVAGEIGGCGAVEAVLAVDGGVDFGG
jgi:hypothetical protein